MNGTLSNNTTLYTQDVIISIVIESISLGWFSLSFILILIVGFANKWWRFIIFFATYPVYIIQYLIYEKIKNENPPFWPPFYTNLFKEVKRRFFIYWILFTTVYYNFVRIISQTLFVIGNGAAFLRDTYVTRVAHFLTVSNNTNYVLIFTLLIIIWFDASLLWIQGHERAKIILSRLLKVVMFGFFFLSCLPIYASAMTILFYPITPIDVYKSLYAYVGPLSLSVTILISDLIVVILGAIIIINVLRSPYLREKKYRQNRHLRNQIMDQIVLSIKIFVSVFIYTIATIAYAVGLILVVADLPEWFRQFFVRSVPNNLAIIIICILFAPINLLRTCETIRKGKQFTRGNIYQVVEVIDEFEEQEEQIINIAMEDATKPGQLPNTFFSSKNVEEFGTLPSITTPQDKQQHTNS